MRVDSVTCSQAAAHGPAPGISRAAPVKRDRPHRTRCSHCTDSAATSGRGPNRYRSQGVNGRGGRNVCMARLRARCARGAAPVAAARGWADSVGRTLTWQPPRGEAGTVQQACTATPPDSRLPAHQANWNNGQTPSDAASSGRRGRSLASRDIPRRSQFWSHSPRFEGVRGRSCPIRAQVSPPRRVVPGQGGSSVVCS